MLGSLRCFFQGHSTELKFLYSPYTLHSDGGKIVPAVDEYCARCEAHTNSYVGVAPPSEEPHRIVVYERQNLFDNSLMFRALCWCGWRSDKWQNNFDVAEAIGAVHEESP